VAGVEHSGVPRRGGRGARVVLAEDSELTAGPGIAAGIKILLGDVDHPQPAAFAQRIRA
jgi:hypothetical protein